MLEACLERPYDTFAPLTPKKSLACRRERFLFDLEGRVTKEHHLIPPHACAVGYFFRSDVSAYRSATKAGPQIK